ncbi:MAG: hypothetical protein ACE5GS_06585 [Kiloniellaceae bacterium]
MRASFRSGLGIVAVEYGIVTLLLSLPVIAAGFGYGHAIGRVYGYLLENVTGVVATLGT